MELRNLIRLVQVVRFVFSHTGCKHFGYDKGENKDSFIRTPEIQYNQNCVDEESR